MGDKRRRFDPEFREGAVRIVKETGKPVAQVARDLGINPYTLHNWVKADRGRGSGSGDGALDDAERRELAELRRLRAETAGEHARQKAEWEKERAELEMEREVLKRSVVLWVKDSMNR
ncbi:transposase [Actinomadura sp. KC06]|uniref:transposase n=1 Tax=Actinomadura sp. KC06 TaxID=2530369 RepID=UPI00104C5512|nr:transposase [Actinomadura sp. KC06]TDD13602.1 transposase [Actinomadura sp. KC06]